MERERLMMGLNQHIIYGYSNVLKCSMGMVESELHRYAKYRVCSFLWRNSIQFYTEASFKKGGRTDIYIRPWETAIEILDTENLKDFLAKKYPCPTIPIKSEINSSELHTMLSELRDTNGGAADYYTKKMIARLE
jgi:hypothetical protein